jgi:Asp-tRNA(Asn)/Glu-tRNA(Gln) amidotransferase A subunit family amidase
VVGLKPAMDEVPTDGVFPLSRSLDHVGPLALSVQDAAWLYAALAHRPWFTVRQVEPATIRLARLTGYFEYLEAEVALAFSRAIDALADAGLLVHTADLTPADRTSQHYIDIVLPEAADVHASNLDSRADDYTPSVHSRILAGRQTSATAYLAAQAFRHELRAAVDRLLDHADALVMPTMPIVAPLLGAETVRLGPDGRDVTVRSAMLKHTQPFNMTGHPAVTLPLPAPGLPVGLQLVGRIGDTPRLLEIAAACERVLSQ